MYYLGSAVTDTGIRKKTNQDSVCVKIADTQEKGQAAMAVICDGMGGLSKGELASAVVIRAFAEWFDQRLPQKIRSYSWQALAAEWERMIKEQNHKILEYGKKIEMEMGTTLSALLIIEGKYMIAHVGDSRIYRITSGVEQLTEDQTLVAREVRRGTLTPEQAAKDSRRHILLQCIGASRNVSPDLIFGDVEPESVYMLCSDGFRHVLTQEEIFGSFKPAILDSDETMKRNSRYLIELVKSRKEKDNISVALLKSMK